MLQHALHERNEINKRFICTVPHEKDVPANRSCPAHLLTAFRCVCFILCVVCVYVCVFARACRSVRGCACACVMDTCFFFWEERGGPTTRR